MKAATNIDLALLRRRLAPLQASWERQAKRIDALSLRERAILFLSIVAVLALLFDYIVLAPQSARAKLRSDAQARQATEVGQLREQFVAASNSGGGPAVQLQAQLETAKADRQALDEGLRSASTINAAEGLPTVLQRLLAQQPGLVLERLTLLDEAPVSAPMVAATGLPSSPSVASPATPAAAPALPGTRWQGVELQVQGSYRDTQRYLQALERELPALRWGEMRMSSAGLNDAPRLLARIYLLKVQP